MNIYLIRHGRQCSKLCNVDVKLAEEGRFQARLLGERMAHLDIDLLYSSDLLRAVETSEIANAYWYARHVIRQGLREISFGDMEGLSDEEIADTFAEFKKRQEKMEEDLPYPGGECAADVVKRAMPVFDEITKSGVKNVAVVTHGGVIRSMVAAFLHMDLKNYRILGNTLENCSITKVCWEEKNKRFYVERFNDYAHLEKHPELFRESWVDAEN